MELSYREKTIKYGIYAAVILLAAFLQNIGGAWFTVFGARCFFLIPVCVLLGLGEDERVSAVIGLFGGMLWDMISAQHRIFCAVFLTLVCYICSSLVTRLFRNTYRYGVIASAASAFLFSIIYWLIYVLIGGGDGRLSALGFFYIPSFIYTAVMAFPLYLVLRPFKAKLNKTALSID